MKTISPPRPGAALLCLLCALWLCSCEQPGGRPGPVPDSDATLESLALSAGTLSPAFNPEITEYKTTVNNAVGEITVTAKPKSEKASVNPGGGTPRPLAEGENVIGVTVTAESGDKKIYTITALRLDNSVAAIGSAAELAKIGVDGEYPPAKDYVLAADLTLENWTPIGSAAAPFSGSFDGAGYTVTIKSFDESVFIAGPVHLGVFAYTRGSVELEAVVKNLVVRTELNHAVTQTGAYYAGALVGYADEYTRLEGIAVEGSLVFSNAAPGAPKHPVYVGGVSGALIASELKDSVVRADITGFGAGGTGLYNYVGGMAGMFDRNGVERGMNPVPVAGAAFRGASITNCRVTGNVSGETDGPGTNVFAGGIAGGAFYGMKTYYGGKIEDCSFTGNVTARGGGYWSWAGGIAGTICGDGHDNPAAEAGGPSATGPTRIVRCHAAGVITGDAPRGGWPYAGGITGYNYYGGLVSQCRFDGTVRAEGDGISDYTGGIAGYNSKQYYGHGSRIEDCRSSGSVDGYVNAGGIVGQNQVAAVTERCYSVARISVRAASAAAGGRAGKGAGGIAGYNAPTDGKAPAAVRNCVALNPSILSGGAFGLSGRVVGNGGGDRGGNLAWSGMTVDAGGGTWAPDPGADKADGEDCGAKPPQSAYEALGWDFGGVGGVWKMGADGYPALQWEEP